LNLSGWIKKAFTPQKKRQQRGFFAASMDRLSADWKTTSGQIDSDLRGDIAVVRARSRELCKSNDYAKKYLRLLKQNIIGSDGFILQVKSFDWDRGPGFDLANFDSYCNSLLESSYRIDSDYLIFNLGQQHVFKSQGGQYGGIYCYCGVGPCYGYDELGAYYEPFNGV
jgi:hypothetical protein